MEELLIKKGYYRHKKGNLYRVLYEAKDSETCEALIVYQAMYGKGEIWVRPKEMFFEEGRFQYVEESEALKLIHNHYEKDDYLDVEPLLQ